MKAAFAVGGKAAIFNDVFAGSVRCTPASNPNALFSGAVHKYRLCSVKPGGEFRGV